MLTDMNLVKTKKGVVGFTLIELLISIALISILTTLGTIGYQNYIRYAHSVDAQNGLRSIYLMQLEWRTDRGSFSTARWNSRRAFSLSFCWR